MPTDQKAETRPIAFRLDTGLGSVVHVPLVIRPEDLVSAEPALQTTVKTLGGAFLDDFGRDLQQIRISGHTGWGQGNRPDGIEEFKKLAAVPRQWRESRAKLAKAGINPANARLYYIDDLNEMCVLVAPGQWQLKRSRARPLLMMYDLPLTVLSDRVQPAATDPLKIDDSGSFSTVKKGLSSLTGSIDSIRSAAGDARSFINGALVAPLHSVMDKSTASMQKVVDVVNGTRGVITDEAAQFAGVARDLALVGRNVFQTYNAIATLPDFAQHQVSAVSAEFANAFCVLGNAFRKGVDYPDYSGIYGASNCSSTIGGSPISPLSGSNPWEILLEPRREVAGVTPDARANIEALKAADPVRFPMSSDELAARATAAMAGITFPWL